RHKPRYAPSGERTDTRQTGGDTELEQIALPRGEELASAVDRAVGRIAVDARRAWDRLGQVARLFADRAAQLILGEAARLPIGEARGERLGDGHLKGRASHPDFTLGLF